MMLWQWVIVIFLPLLAVEHFAINAYLFFTKDGGTKKRDEEWQKIFSSISEAFRVNAGQLIETWGAMKQANEHLEKLVLKKTQRNKPPENPFGHTRENPNGKT